MSAAEDLILTITAGGLGQDRSSHDYPVRGRGGQGVKAMDKADARRRLLVASFPVEMGDQVMLATSHRPVDPLPGGGHLVPLALGRRGACVRHPRRRRGRLGRPHRRPGDTEPGDNGDAGPTDGDTTSRDPSPQAE